MSATDDPELAEFEQRRRANLKTLALIGLVAVCSLLLWKCATQAERLGLGVGGPGKAVARPLEITVERAGTVKVRDCYGELEDCLARAKVRARNGASDRVSIRVESGAPETAVAPVRELVTHFELVPVID